MISWILTSLGFIDHNITINIIENEKIVEKKNLKLPKEIRNVIRCKTRAASHPSSRAWITYSYSPMRRIRSTGTILRREIPQKEKINHTCQKQGSADPSYSLSAYAFLFLRCSSIPFAPAFPAPIARMTVAAPVTASPPANTPSLDVWPFSSSATMHFSAVCLQSFCR